MIALLALSDLIKPVSPTQAKATILGLAQQLGLSTETWAEGGFTRITIAIMAQLISTMSGMIALVAAGGFLDLAKGGWLTLLAWNVYRVARLDALAASGQIVLTNTGGGRYDVDPGDLTFAHATTRKTYRNTTGGTLNPGNGQTLTLTIQAEEDGPDSTAQPGTITVLVTTLLGVTCSNPAALVGIAEELDPALAQRCRDSLALLSPGAPKAAYLFVAKSALATDGTPLGITRARLMPALGDGNVDMYVATPSGAASSDQVARVQELEDARVTPYGFTTTVLMSTNVPISAPLTIWISDSVTDDDTAVKTNVATLMGSSITTAPIGGFVVAPATGKIYWRMLLGAAERAYPSDTIKVQLATETDISVPVGGVPQWTGLSADVTVIRVPS